MVTLSGTLWDLAVRFKFECKPGNDLIWQDLTVQQGAWQNATWGSALAYGKMKRCLGEEIGDVLVESRDLWRRRKYYKK